MKRLIFIFGIVLVGCNEGEYSNKSFIINHTEKYFIPDSNKQKFSDFVSKSVSGCQEDCVYYLRNVEKAGGKIFGIEIVELKVRKQELTKCNSSINCFDSVLFKNELNDEQNEAVKNYFVKEN